MFPCEHQWHLKADKNKRGFQIQRFDEQIKEDKLLTNKTIFNSSASTESLFVVSSKYTHKFIKGFTLDEALYDETSDGGNLTYHVS